MRIGDLVCYIREDNEREKKLGSYPPIGTIGRIIGSDDCCVRVQWPKGTTNGNSIWLCNIKDVKLVHTINGWLMAGIFDDFAKCPYCGQSNYPLSAVMEWKFCPYCGEKINYEETD